MNGPSVEEYHKFVEDVAPFIDVEVLEKARKVNFGQWELPFEAILINLTKCRRHEINLGFSNVKSLAVEAGITIEGGVLDPSSWANFLKWELGG